MLCLMFRLCTERIGDQHSLNISGIGVEYWIFLLYSSGFMPDAGRTTLVPIKDRVPRGMGEWAHWNIPSKLNDLPLAYLRSICELRLMYQTRSLTSIMKLLSPCRPEGDDVTLVTTCTPDRLKRLEYVVEAWNGPVCVAVYYRRQFGCKFTSCEHLISRLKKWHSTVCKRKKIVDLSLVVDDKQHVQHIAPIGTVASGEQPEDCNDCTLLRTRYRCALGLQVHAYCCDIKINLSVQLWAAEVDCTFFLAFGMSTL